MDDLVPSRPDEQAIMVAIWDRPPFPPARRDRAAECLRGMGLTRSGDVVVSALDGAQRRAGDILRADVMRAGLPRSQGKPVFLKRYANRVEKVVFGHVEYRARDHACQARELRAWQVALGAEWHEVHFGAVEVKAEGDQWCISVPVYLGEIAPAWVRVELYADSNAEHPSECVPMNSVGSVSGAVNGYIFSTSVSMLRPADHYTPRVRAWHAAAFLPAESALIAWQR